MFRTKARAIGFASLLVFCCFNLHAQSGPPQHPPRPTVVGPAKWNPTPQELSAAYWTLESGWDTTLEIRNNVRYRELTVTAVLRTAAGQEIPLTPVTVAPQNVIAIDLRNLSQTDTNNASYVGLFGSVVFRFSGLNASNVFAATIVRREGQPIDFHFDADQAGSPAYQSGGVEGIWWLPAQTSNAFLILSNPSKKTVAGSVLLSASSSNRRIPLNLTPGQMQRIDLRQALGSSNIGAAGGLTISLPGHESISATQIVFDEITGLTAIMKLFDRDPNDQPKGHVLVAPMMALNQPDADLAFPTGTTLQPMIFLRNATPGEEQVSLTVDWRGESKSGTFIHPPIALPPGEVQVLRLNGQQGFPSIPSDANWATARLSYIGRVADVVPVAISYDKTYRYGLQTPFSDALSRLWAGGMWHVDPTHDTLITTGNGGKEPTTAEVTLFYNGGVGRYRMEKMLTPGQQLWLDLAQLAHDQVPDSDGHTLPPDTTMGSYELRDLDHATIGQLYEGKLVIDKTFGHAAYGCGSCCGYDAVVLDPDPFQGPLGIESNDYIYANDTCAGDQEDVTGSGYDWKTANAAIATLPNRTLHTVAVGSTTGSALAQLQWAHPPSCPVQDFGTGQTVTVQPSLSLSPSMWFFGVGNNPPASFTLGSNQGTVTANGASGGSFSWAITNGASIASFASGSQKSSTTTSGNTVTVYSIGYSTSANDVTIQLTWTPSGGSANASTLYFQVDSPYKLVAGAITNSGASGSTCNNPPPGTAGFQSKVNYTILSFFGVQLSNIGVNETFGDQGDDYIGNNWPPYTAGGTTATTGFFDNICAINQTVPPSLPPQSPLSSTKIDHGSQAWFVGSVNSGSGVEVQSDTLQRYQDHGSQLSIVSPTR